MNVESNIDISPRAMFRNMGDETVILDLGAGPISGSIR